MIQMNDNGEGAGNDAFQPTTTDLSMSLSNMGRCELLRQFRELERADEEARRLQDSREDEEEYSSGVTVIPVSGLKMFHYDKFLSNQSYYDDWKHADYDLINYGSNTFFPRGKDGTAAGNQSSESSLVIEQRKKLGKGGFCWDSAFILAQHLLSTEKEWNNNNDHTPSPELGSWNTPEPLRVLELGSGTGLVGLALAKYVQYASIDMTVTDLPEFVPLMNDNIHRNFPYGEHEEEKKSGDAGGRGGERVIPPSRIQAETLRWGVKEHYPPQKFDVVIGADVVASIYDPVALAHTFHDLCRSSDTSRVYVAYRDRLEGTYEKFENEMRVLFTHVRTMKPRSTNLNPNVFIVEAHGKVEFESRGGP